MAKKTPQASKPVELEVFGPFELQTEKVGKTRMVTMSAFDLVALAHQQYPKHAFDKKRGCYVFALRNGRGSMPYYIGKAQSQELCKEALTPDKLTKYNRQLAKKQGTPVLYFVASAREGDNILAATVVKELERELIDFCYSANPDGIINSHHVAAARGRFRVAGVPWMGAGRAQGKPSKTAREFNQLFGIA
jgi:hypothetical protein